MRDTGVVNVCQVGHASHDVIEVSTTQGPFRVFDVGRYMGAAGMYCTGQDVVSDRLAVEGHWEPHDTPVIEAILRRGDRSRLVIDFGCHIGWYTIMAAGYGYTVLAIDADAENLELLRQTAVLHDVGHLITTMHAWVDESFTLDVDRDVELVKIDLEGSDRHAVAACASFLDRVRHLYVEISPAFRDDYPALVDRLTAAGFEAWWPEGLPFNGEYDLSQFNLRFSR